MNETTSTRRPHVVIAGGGVAALEALIALREVAGDRIRITLISPERDFVYRPMAVAEPFFLGHQAHHPLKDIAAEFDATLVHDALVEVESAARTVTGREGEQLEYDSLLVAVGARTEPAYRHALTFSAEGGPEAFSGLLADLEEGYFRRVAFVAPSGLAWSLPLYELAIMTARHLWDTYREDSQVTIVTPEARPLEIFGPDAATRMGDLLARQGIDFVGSVHPQIERRAVLAGGRRIDVDRAVALPRLAGRRIQGLPGDDLGFLPVDDHGRVEGLDGVFGAGDGTTFPVKQGGLAAQQAVAAAEAIAARHGADLEPAPFRPVLRGMLLTGGQPRWLRAPVGTTPGNTRASVHALWWPPTKIASRYLAPYLLGGEDAAELSRPPAGGHPVERDLELLATPRRTGRS